MGDEDSVNKISGRQNKNSGAPVARREWGWQSERRKGNSSAKGIQDRVGGSIDSAVVKPQVIVKVRRYNETRAECAGLRVYARYLDIVQCEAKCASLFAF